MTDNTKSPRLNFQAFHRRKLAKKATFSVPSGIDLGVAPLPSTKYHRGRFIKNGLAHNRLSSEDARSGRAIMDSLNGVRPVLHHGDLRVAVDASRLRVSEGWRRKKSTVSLEAAEEALRYVPGNHYTPPTALFQGPFQPGQILFTESRTPFVPDVPELRKSIPKNKPVKKKQKEQIFYLQEAFAKGYDVPEDVGRFYWKKTSGTKRQRFQQFLQFIGRYEMSIPAKVTPQSGQEEDEEEDTRWCRRVRGAKLPKKAPKVRSATEAPPHYAPKLPAVNTFAAWFQNMVHYRQVPLPAAFGFLAGTIEDGVQSAKLLSTVTGILAYPEHVFNDTLKVYSQLLAEVLGTTVDLRSWFSFDDFVHWRLFAETEDWRNKVFLWSMIAKGRFVTKFIAECGDVCLNDIFKFFNSIFKSDVQPQADGMFGEKLKFLRGSASAQKTALLLGQMAGKGVFKDSWFSKFFDTRSNYFMMSKAENTTSMDFVQTLIEFAEHWLNVFNECIIAGNLNPLLKGSDDEQLFNSMMEMTETLRIERQKATTKVVELVNQALIIGEKGMRSKVGSLKKLGTDLFNTAMEMRNSFSNERTPPAAFIFTGVPGTGKTEICAELAKIVAFRDGIPAGVNTLHTYSNTSHEKLPTVVKTVLFNDFFTSKESITGVPVLPMLQSLVDTAPFSFEGAAIGDKNVCIAPKLVLITTNQKKYWCEAATGGANKLNGRYELIRVIPNPVWYEKHKVKPDDYRLYFKSHQWDRNAVLYQIGELTSTSGAEIKLTLETVREELTYEELMNYMISQVDYMSKSKKRHADCVNCHFSVDSCLCKWRVLSFEQQGGVMSAQVSHSIDDESIDRVMEGLSKPLREANLALGTVKSILGIIVVAQAVRMVCHAWNFFNEQGALVSKVDNMEEETTAVRPYESTHLPWTGPRNKVKVFKIKSRKTFMHCIPINRSIVAVPAHFFQDLVKGDPIELTDIKVSVSYDPALVATHRDKDLAFYAIPGMIGVEQFAYEFLPTRDVAGDGSIEFDGTTYVSSGNRKHIAYAKEDTKCGDCGIPIYQGSKIVGFHVGQAQSLLKAPRGVAVRLCRQDFLDFESFFSKQYISQVGQVNTVDFNVEAMGLRDGLHPNGTGAWSERSDTLKLSSADHLPMAHLPTHFPEKVRVGRTALYDRFAHLAAPMGAPYTGKAKPNKDGLYRNPAVFRLLSGYEIPKTQIDMALIARCCDDYVNHLPIAKLEPLSLYESICGSPHNVLINPRDNSKAIGAWLKSYGITKANAFTDKGGGNWDIHPLVLEKLQDLENLIRSDEPLPPTLVTATIKEEVYPQAKIDENKGRLFYVGDFRLNILMRRYLLPIIALCLEFPEFSKCIVTINATSIQWSKLGQRLQRFGNRVFAADQKEYDLRHNVLLSFLPKVYAAMARKFGYSEKDIKCVERVCVMANRYYLLMDSDVYLCNSKWNSGRPDTIFGNCVMGCILMMYAFYKEEPHGKSFWEFVEAAFTGDDNVTNVSALCKFTGEHYRFWAATLGYTITREDKKMGEIQFQKLAEVSYLKRRWYEWFLSQDSKTVTAPLEWQSIFKSLAYYSGKANSQELHERQRNVIMSAQREAFLYGRGRFYWMQSMLHDVMTDDITLRFETLAFEYESDMFKTWTSSADVEICKPLIDEDYTVVNEGLELPLVKYSDSDCAVINPRGLAPGGRSSTLNGLEELTSTRSVDCGLTSTDDQKTTEQHNAGETASSSGAQLNYSSENRNEVDAAPVIHTGMNALEGIKEQPGRMSLRPVSSEIDLANIYSRKRLVKTWDATDNVSMPVFQDWLAIPEVTSFMSSWQLFRGNARLTFMVTGSAQIMGKTRIWAQPNASGDDYTVQPYSLAGTSPDYYCVHSQLPHIDIDLSQTGTYEMELPFPNQRDFIAKNGNDWFVYIVPVNLPETTDGSTARPITINVYVQYEDVTLDRIIPQAGTLPELSMTPVAGLLAYAARVSAVVPHAFATPVSKALSLGSNLAQYMGYAKPPMEAQESVVVRFNPNIAAVIGQGDFSQTLAIDTATCKNQATPLPLAEPDDMKLAHLLSKWTQIQRNWFDNGASYVQLNVEPGIVVDSPTGSFMLPTSTFVAGAFNFWQGPVEVCIEIVGSPLVRWRLGIVVLPPGVAVPPSFPSTGHLSTVIDAAGTTCAEMEIPYMYTSPFTEIELEEVNVAISSKTRIVAYSLTIPTGPGSTPVYPRVNVYWRAPKLQLGVPSLAKFDLYRVDNQAGGVGPSSTAHFGETFEDIKVLMSRPCRNWVFQPALPLSLNVVHFPVFPLGETNGSCMGTAGTDFIRSWSFINYFSLAFRGNIGGIVHRLRVSGTALNYDMYAHNVRAFCGTSITVGRIFKGISYEGDSARGSNVTVLRNAAWLEVRVPDRNDKNFRAPNVDDTGPASVEGLTVIVRGIGGVDEPQVPIEDWVSAADDYMVGGYLFAPLLRLR